MNKWYDHYMKKINDSGGIINYKNHKISYKLPLLELIKKYAKNKKIMEVGSGVGISLIELSRQGYQVIGIENDVQMLNLSLRLAKEFDSDIKVINADLTNHDYSNYSIDVIFSNGVMEHFSDSEIIDTLNKQLASNAYIIVSIPTDFFKPEMAYNGDERFLSPNEWVNIIEKSNGEIVEMYSYDDKVIEIKKVNNFSTLEDSPRFSVFIIK